MSKNFDQQGGFSKVFVVVIIILVVITGSFYLFNGGKTDAVENAGTAGLGIQTAVGDEPIACPADAFVCPDGTVVTRVPPACKVFAPCPKPVPAKVE